SGGLALRLGLGRATKALGVGETAHAVSLRILDARGVALHTDPQTLAEIKGFLVGKPELSRQLVDPDPLVRHLRSANPFQLAAHRAVRGAPALAQQSFTQPGQLMPRDLAPQRPAEGPAPHRVVETRFRTGAQPGSPPGLAPTDGQRPVGPASDPHQPGRAALAAATDAGALRNTGAGGAVRHRPPRRTPRPPPRRLAPQLQSLREPRPPRPPGLPLRPQPVQSLKPPVRSPRCSRRASLPLRRSRPRRPRPPRRLRRAARPFRPTRR